MKRRLPSPELCHELYEQAVNESVGSPLTQL